MLAVDSGKIWVAAYAVFTMIIGISAYIGITYKYMLPVAPIFLGATIVFAVAVAFSKFGTNLLDSVSFTSLLGLMSFRLPLEYVLHLWGKSQTIPMTMTWSGQNYDVIAGVLCLAGIPFYEKSTKVVWTINLISFFLLLNVIRVVIMSSPFPISWDLEIPLQLIMNMPYAIILPGCVGVAFASHLLVFRKLYIESR